MELIIDSVADASAYAKVLLKLSLQSPSQLQLKQYVFSRIVLILVSIVVIPACPTAKMISSNFHYLIGPFYFSHALVYSVITHLSTQCIPIFTILILPVPPLQPQGLGETDYLSPHHTIFSSKNVHLFANGGEVQCQSFLKAMQSGDKYLER